MTAGAPPAISVQGLRKAYAGRAVVDGIDLAVAGGSIHALLGPNGAGKTTTVEILEGYRSRDGGDVRVLGLDPARDGTALRGRVGLMLQGGGIYPQARPLEILRLYARFFRQPRDPGELLETVGLGDVARTRYRVLSGGQRQRLGLALALVGRPELVMLDEPTAGMDPAAKAATRELIDTLRSSGVTILLTTHELADVERLADEITIIDRGRIVARGSPAALAGGGASTLRLRFDRALDASDRAALETVLRSAVGSPAPTARLEDDGGPGRYRLTGRDPDPALLGAIAAWCADRGILIVELRAGGATLEERYLELTGDGGGDAE